MKAIEILKDIEESKWCGVKPTLSNYNLELYSQEHLGIKATLGKR